MSDDIPTAEDVKGILSDVEGYSHRRLMGAVENAIRDLPDKYDSVDCIKALPVFVRFVELVASMEGDFGDSAERQLAMLQKARGDDA